ncbi:HipA family kinase [Agrobacterium vitis]|uniref:HipA family kinase n=1 Tax=Agrobacterium vitis TaxID=373 RepID=UPI003B52AFE3
MQAGTNWRPTRIERINTILSSSTKPLLAVTDLGTAVVKYMGNKAGLDVLVTELIAAELANRIGLKTPDFAVVEIPSITTADPFVTIEAGPAFFSRWEQAYSLSPNSKLLADIRRLHDIARLVTFDTWIRNKDRFAGDANGGIVNYDNILFKADKRKTQLLVIDHSHAFAETTLEDEISDLWATEKSVYGLFNEFVPMLTRRDIESALHAICAVEINDIEDICLSTPPQWGFTTTLAKRLAGLLAERAKLMNEWLPDAIFAQMELDLHGKEA